MRLFFLMSLIKIGSGAALCSTRPSCQRSFVVRFFQKLIIGLFAAAMLVTPAQACKHRKKKCVSNDTIATQVTPSAEPAEPDIFSSDDNVKAPEPIDEKENKNLETLKKADLIESSPEAMEAFKKLPKAERKKFIDEKLEELNKSSKPSKPSDSNNEKDPLDDMIKKDKNPNSDIPTKPALPSANAPRK